MDSSPEPTTPTDDGETDQFDGHLVPGTDRGSRHSNHPFFGGLRPQRTSNISTVDPGQGSIHPESSEVPSSEPPRASPHDDVLMTERDLAESMPGIMEEDDKKRRAAGKPRWSGHPWSDNEREQVSLEKLSAVPKTPHRRMSHAGPTRSSGVSKTPRSGPRRRNTNQEPDMPARRLRAWGMTEAVTRSQTAMTRSRGWEPSASDERTVGDLEGGVEHDE
jgi:hypothetical protein